MAKDFSQMAHYLSQQTPKAPEEDQTAAESVKEAPRGPEVAQKEAGEEANTGGEKAADPALEEAPESVAVMMTQEQLNAMIKKAQKEALEEAEALFTQEQARIERIEQTLETRRTKRFATMLRPVLYEILEEESQGLPGGPSGLANQILESHYALKISEKVNAALEEYEKADPAGARDQRRRLSFDTHYDYMSRRTKK